MLADDRELSQAELIRDLDRKPQRLQSGRVVLRPTVCPEMHDGLEVNFLDLYIGTRYEPPVRDAGSSGYVTVVSGILQVETDGQYFRLEERDTLCFRADHAFALENAISAVTHLLLFYQAAAPGGGTI